MNLKGRNFLTLKDFTPEEITYLIDLSAELKAKKKAGELHEYYRGILNFCMPRAACTTLKTAICSTTALCP